MPSDNFDDENRPSSSSSNNGAGVIQKYHMDPSSHVTALYTAQDHAWIQNFYKPFDKANFEFPIAERKNGTVKINRFKKQCLAKYGLPCKFITVTGNGGTGKSYTGISVASISPRILCSATTQVGGRVLEAYLERRIGPIKPVVYNTVFQALNLTVDEQNANVAYLCSNEESLDPRIAKFECDTIEEWWALTGDRWYVICQELFKKRLHGVVGKASGRAKWITPEVYSSAQDDLIRVDPHDKRSLNQRIISHLLLQKGVSGNKIPDPLMYTHYMIDEAGRGSAVLMLFLVAYHYFVHQMYDTDEVDKVPTIILLGSNKQSQTINTPIGPDKKYYPILDKDMLSVTTTPMFADLYNRGLLLRRNKVYNRRLHETHSPRITSLVMELNSALENNDDQALKTLAKLSKIPGVSKPITDFFYKEEGQSDSTDSDEDEDAKREEERRKANIRRKNKRKFCETTEDFAKIEGAYLRVCTKHTDNTTVIKNFKRTNKNDVEVVCERVYTISSGDGEDPKEIFDANILFCPGFNDETYLTPNWEKEDNFTSKQISKGVLLKLVGPNLLEQIGKDEVLPIVRYKGERNLFLDNFYVTSHHCKCRLNMLSGDLDKVLSDFNSVFSMSDQNGAFLCSVIIAILTTLIDFVNIQSDVPLEEIMKQVLKERADAFSKHMKQRSTDVKNTYSEFDSDDEDYLQESDDADAEREKKDTVKEGTKSAIFNNPLEPSVEDTSCYSAILKTLVEMREDVQSARPEFFNTASSSKKDNDTCQRMYELKSKFITVVNYCKLLKRENEDLPVNFNVMSSYGPVYVFIPRSSRVLLTGVSENQLSIRLGRTMALTLFRTAFRVDAEIKEYPSKQVIFYSEENKRLYKKKQPGAADTHSRKTKANHSKADDEDTYELNADDLFDGDFSDDNEDYYNQLDEHDMDQQSDLTEYVNERTEEQIFTNSTEDDDTNNKNGYLNRKKKKYTCVEIFPIKTGMVSTSAALQGVELDVPHCVLVNRKADAHSMIVACSRATNANDLSFCFDCPVEQVEIVKLPSHKVFEHKMIMSQEQGGPLEQPLKKTKLS